MTTVSAQHRAKSNNQGTRTAKLINHLNTMTAIDYNSLL